ncbi:hypothetical protein ACWGOQ_0015735 [Aquimarina sp. M1]
MKIQKCFLLLVIVVITGCSSQSNQYTQPEYLGDGIVDLDKLSFDSFNVEKFYEKVLKEGNHYSKDSVYSGPYYSYFDKNNMKLPCFHYSRDRTNSTDSVAKYNSLFFSKLYTITNLNNVPMSIGASTSFDKILAIDSRTVNEALKQFQKTLGTPIVKKERFVSTEYLSNTWELEDKHIRLVVVAREDYNEFSSDDLKVVINQKDNEISPKNPKVTFRIIMFITHKIYKEEIKDIPINKGIWVYYSSSY